MLDELNEILAVQYEDVHGLLSASHNFKDNYQNGVSHPTKGEKINLKKMQVQENENTVVLRFKQVVGKSKFLA